MPIRYPAPLRPGDRVAVTAPSTGMGPRFEPRLEVCRRHLERLGYEVVLGECLRSSETVSAPAAARAEELQRFLTDPNVRAVVPPWGGELAIDLLELLDFEAIAAAEPTWLVGYSDLATLMLPITVVTGIATLHGSNIADTPFRLPEWFIPWTSIASGAASTEFEQRPSTRFQGSGFADFAEHPEIDRYVLDTPTSVALLDGDVTTEREITGRLIGGCLEVVSMLPGSRYGDLPGFATRHAPEGLVVYLEVAEENPYAAARMFMHLRLAGWFEHANAVLIGRPAANDHDDFSQLDAVRFALGDLGIPVVTGLDVGHVAPQWPVVNGALGTLRTGPEGVRLSQRLE